MSTKSSKGTITDIKRFAIHDGRGIRTTVFFKGCPLRCVWCHNPESIDFSPELGYFQSKCINCGECASVCTEKAQTIVEGRHLFNRELCIGCGKCESVCPTEATRLYGREITVEELVPVLLEDIEYYRSTGGGVTLSGGECLSQAEFCVALLKRLKEEGVITAVDTCGFVNRASLEMAAEYTDVFLYDIKAIDEEVHHRCTGHSNRAILDNLRYLDSIGKSIEIRIPYVPGYNSDQIPKIKSFVANMKSITGVKVLSYHDHAEYKYRALGIESTLPSVIPTDEEIRAAQSIF